MISPLQLLKNIDEALLKIADHQLGEAEERGVMVPTFLREATLLRMVTAFLIIIVFLTVDELWSLTFIIAFFEGRRLRTDIALYKQFNQDSKKEWTESLNKKYVDRALFIREALRIPRIGNLIFVPVIILPLFFYTLHHTEFMAVFAALTARYLSFVFAYYIEGAVPKPPPQKEAKLKFSHSY